MGFCAHIGGCCCCCCCCCLDVLCVELDLILYKMILFYLFSSSSSSYIKKEKDKGPSHPFCSTLLDNIWRCLFLFLYNNWRFGYRFVRDTCTVPRILLVCTTLVCVLFVATPMNWKYTCNVCGHYYLCVRQ